MKPRWLPGSIVSHDSLTELCVSPKGAKFFGSLSGTEEKIKDYIAFEFKFVNVSMLTALLDCTLNKMLT